MSIFVVVSVVMVVAISVLALERILDLFYLL